MPLHLDNEWGQEDERYDDGYGWKAGFCITPPLQRTLRKRLTAIDLVGYNAAIDAGEAKISLHLTKNTLTF